MCGIAALYRPDGGIPGERDVQRMVDAIAHRGPDGQGVLVEPHVGLGHARLSILDLSDRAAQPMVSQDGRYAISFNGEIFNFVPLRHRLESVGVRLRSTGDTEVLLEHLARFGIPATLELLEGDFAIVLWDRRQRELVLARDRHGVKPLYYSVDRPDEVRVSSELKALRTDDAVDITTLNAMLLGLSGTWGDRTLHPGIRSVRPGEWIVFAGSADPIRRDFASLLAFVDDDLADELRGQSERAVLDRLDEALADSVSLRLQSDAPVACLVSGGVDSSLLTSLALRSDPDLGLYHADVLNDSERPAAEALATHVGRPLRTVSVSDHDFLDSVALATHHNDLPLIYHLNSVPFLRVCQLAAEDGVKVILTGEGSDEYFLGYPQLAVAPIEDKLDATKRWIRRRLHGMSSRLAGLLWPDTRNSFPSLLGKLVFRYEEEVVGRAADHALATSTAGSWGAREQRATLVLIQEHLTSLLHRNDRLGMAAGLESRFPFLGHELAKLAVNLPPGFKLRRSLRPHDRRHPFVIDKWCVREVAERHVPGALARRTKQGFPVSIYDRLSVGEELLTSGFVADTFGLDRRTIAELVDTAPRPWMTRLMLLEVWGQVHARGQRVEEIQEQLHKHVALRP